MPLLTENVFGGSDTRDLISKEGDRQALRNAYCINPFTAEPVKALHFAILV